MDFSIQKLPGNFLVRVMQMDDTIIVKDDYYYYNYSTQFGTIVCRKNLSDYKSIAAENKFDQSKQYYVVNDSNQTLADNIKQSFLLFLDAKIV
jgi:hypothetical protein